MERRGGGVEDGRGPDRVILVSTRTIDRLPLSDGSVREIPGGPATYVAEAFRRLGRQFTLITGERADVEVIPGEDGQEYIIPALPPIALPPRLTASAVLISPIVGEVPPDAIPPVDGLLVVDLQGFVREAGRPTGVFSRPFDLTGILRRAHVVKGSTSELCRLTHESRRVLRHRLLLESRGGQGLVLHDGARDTRFDASPIASPHTIGAGDTMLAAFVDSLLTSNSPASAAREAVAFTETVLRERAAP
jgi:sugar/nucleoside kinase (ribokinase family)